MTKEDIACIIQWFVHIEQLATDRKNANGIVMEDMGHLLNTIKVIAKDSREYVERFCQPSLSSNLDEAAKEYEKRVIEETKCHHNALTYAEGYEDALLLIPDAFIAGAKWDKEQMMSNAVEGTVYGNGVYTWVAGDIPSQFKYGDKVRVIVLPKED